MRVQTRGERSAGTKRTVWNRGVEVLLAAAGACIFCITPAHAGDARLEAAGAAPGRAVAKKNASPPAFSWTGFYLGGNIGGGTSHINFSGTGVFTIAGVADPFAFANGTASGILAGGQLGFNYELPAHMVLGLEADLDGSSFHGLTTFCSTGTGGPLLGRGVNCETSNNKLEQFSTVRGRVGYSFDNKVLVYGTGGFAWEKSSTLTTATCVTVKGSCPAHGVKFTDGTSEASATLNGWAAGVGIEWALTPRWILRVEYLHLAFDRGAENFSGSGTASRVPFTVAGRNSLSNDVDFARVGLSYLFNFDNPVDWERSSSGTRGTASGSNANAVSDFFADWQALVAQARADQPNWATPLVTTTGLLLHRYRFDLAEQHIGNGGQTTVLDGGKGVDLIVGERTEIQMAAPSYDIRNTPTGKGVFSGFTDWGFFRVKQQLASSPSSADDYLVSVLLQAQAPTGVPQLTSNAWTLLPTLAVGKGWGDFNVQASVTGTLPASNVSALGDQIQTNVAFQYRLMKVLSPELEVSWTYWIGGPRDGLNQVFLTPNIIIGRLPLADNLTLTAGFGYQFAVAPSYRPNPLTPSYGNAWLFTTRINF
jgi:opacity protein-like surface antigen